VLFELFKAVADPQDEKAVEGQAADVDGADLFLLSSDMNTVCPPNDACYSDISDDGRVDEDDLQIFAPAFGWQ